MGALDFLGGIFGAGASIYSAERQIKFQREVLKNRYQYLVGDLEKAGLNKMLAIGGASPPASAPGASADIAGGFEKGSRGASNVRKQDLERDNVRANTQLVTEQAGAARSTSANQLSQARLNETNNEIRETEVFSAQARERFDKGPGGETLRQIKRATEPFTGVLKKR